MSLLLSLLLLGCTQQQPSVDTSSEQGQAQAEVGNQQPVAEEQSAASPAGVAAKLAECMEHVQGPPYSSFVAPWAAGICYGEAARATIDAGYCNQLLEFSYGSEEARVKNYKQCAGRTYLGKVIQEPAVCEALELEIGRDVCFFGLAQNTNNPEFCSRIVQDVNEHNGCLRLLAEELRDASVCDSIDGENAIRSCYSRLATLLG
ncbi:hypothetical protein HY571_00860, partial [Candidatus Micrarchaeota archaeon]|nr:hypothetical protein [Candidatus Micrarchaeota archaeon]